jgi:hypothetical protein
MAMDGRWAGRSVPAGMASMFTIASFRLMVAAAFSSRRCTYALMSAEVIDLGHSPAADHGFRCSTPLQRGGC